MGITLDEAVRLLEAKKTRIYQLRNERTQSAVVRHEEGESEEFISRPERSVDCLTKEINFLSRQVQKLQRLLSKANVETPTDIELDGDKLFLGEVIVAIRQFREGVPYLNQLAGHKKEKRKSRSRELINGSYEMVQKVEIIEPQYNLTELREKIQHVEMMIQKMQATINKANVETTIDFEDAAYQG